MRTSYSALDTFQKCPQKFKFQIIDKIKAPPSVEAVFGSAVHASLKFMFSRDPLFPTLNEILANFSETWKSSSAKVMPKLTDELKSVYEDSGKEILKKFHKKNPPWNFSVVDTESRFEVLLSDPNPPASPDGTVGVGGNSSHVLAGIIDRIDKIGDGEYEIIDYKTNRRLPSQDEIDANLQMSLYHMAITKKWPNIEPEKIQLSLYFLKHGEKLSSRRSADALNETKENVLKTIREIEQRTAANDFPPNPSKLCDYCPYKSICPAWKHFYKKDPATLDEAQLQQAIQEYFSIKDVENKNSKRIKELQNIVSAYMDANGLDRVFDDRGYYISRKLQQRFKYDFDKVRDILVKAGLEDKWQAILDADEKKLKLIMNELPLDIRAKIADQKTLSKEFQVLVASTKPISRS